MIVVCQRCSGVRFVSMYQLNMSLVSNGISERLTSR